MLFHITLLDNLRGNGEAVPLYATKLCVGVEVQLHIFSISALDGGEWSLSHLTTLPRRKRPRLPLNLWLDVPQRVWTFRRLAESVSPAVNPVAISRVYPTALVTVPTVTADRSFTSTPPHVFGMDTGQLTLCVHTCDKRAAETGGLTTANQLRYYAAVACTRQ